MDGETQDETMQPPEWRSGPENAQVALKKKAGKMDGTRVVFKPGVMRLVKSPKSMSPAGRGLTATIAGGDNAVSSRCHVIIFPARFSVMGKKKQTTMISFRVLAALSASTWSFFNTSEWANFSSLSHSASLDFGLTAHHSLFMKLTLRSVI